MIKQIKRIFANRPVSPRKRVLGPVVSAVVSFLLPGAAQAVNGQIVKGACVMLTWLALYSAAGINAVLYGITRVLQAILMVVTSSDAYFIAARMKLGEEVRAWSILFFDIHSPAGTAAAGVQKNGGLRTLITDVTVIDGTGAPAFQSDVLIEGGVISCIRPGLQRREKEYTIVEGTGRILIPGFLNPCCCCEGSVFGSDGNTQAVRQGITTEILGANGQSLAPVRESERETMKRRFSAVHGGRDPVTTFDNTGLYLMELERQDYPAKLESMIGYGTLRDTVLGSNTGRPDSQALQLLCSRVRSGIASGAKGISLGLAYPPCSFAEDDELLAVFRAAAESGGIISAQLPFGEGQLLPGLSRLGALARKADAPLLITNVHAVGTDRALADEMCRQVEQLRKEGVKVDLAVTGLDCTHIGLTALTPAGLWTEQEAQRQPRLDETARRLASVGGPSAVLVEREKGGLITLADESLQRGCSPEELIFTLLEEQGGTVSGLLRTGDEAFLSKLLEQPYTCICTDDLMMGKMDFTVPYFLGRYVKQLGVLTMEQAVHRGTMAQAARFRLWDRALIREGMAADLVLLRPELLPGNLEDGATRGISKVWVGGVLQYDAEPVMNLNSLPNTKFFGIQMQK